MTIQLSVVVWTVINFSLLMVILHHLLFKPVLRVLDQRKQRIQAAHEKKAAAEQQASAHRAMLLEQQATEQRQHQQQLRETLEAFRVQSKHVIDTAQDERLARVEQYRAQAEIEQNKILDALDGHAAELASTFADSVIKG